MQGSYGCDALSHGSAPNRLVSERSTTIPDEVIEEESVVIPSLPDASGAEDGRQNACLVLHNS